jgi:hypothetical protein
MESFESIRKKHIENMMDELKTLGRRLIELGWSQEQVCAYVKQVLEDPTDPASGDPDTKED